MVRQLLADGSASAGDREIDEAEARIVRRIFTEYAGGTGPGGSPTDGRQANARPRSARGRTDGRYG